MRYEVVLDERSSRRISSRRFFLDSLSDGSFDRKEDFRYCLSEGEKGISFHCLGVGELASESMFPVIPFPFALSLFSLSLFYCKVRLDHLFVDNRSGERWFFLFLDSLSDGLGVGQSQ